MIVGELSWRSNKLYTRCQIELLKHLQVSSFFKENAQNSLVDAAYIVTTMVDSVEGLCTEEVFAIFGT